MNNKMTQWYTPNPYTTREQWVAHIAIFLFVLVLSTYGMIVADGALWVLSFLAATSNVFVLGLAYYETLKASSGTTNANKLQQ